MSAAGSNLFVTQLGSNDVLVGRGAPSNSNLGNRRFRELVQSRKREYMATAKRQTKDKIAREIVESIVYQRGGRFLRKIESLVEAEQLGVPEGATAWTLVSEDVAVQKTKQALRDRDIQGAAGIEDAQQQAGTPPSLGSGRAPVHSPGAGRPVQAGSVSSLSQQRQQALQRQLRDTPGMGSGLATAATAPPLSTNEGTGVNDFLLQRANAVAASRLGAATALARPSSSSTAYIQAALRSIQDARMAAALGGTNAAAVDNSATKAGSLRRGTASSSAAATPGTAASSSASAAALAASTTGLPPLLQRHLAAASAASAASRSLTSPLPADPRSDAVSVSNRLEQPVAASLEQQRRALLDLQQQLQRAARLGITPSSLPHSAQARLLLGGGNAAALAAPGFASLLGGGTNRAIQATQLNLTNADQQLALAAGSDAERLPMLAAGGNAGGGFATQGGRLGGYLGATKKESLGQGSFAPSTADDVKKSPKSSQFSSPATDAKNYETVADLALRQAMSRVGEGTTNFNDDTMADLTFLEIQILRAAYSFGLPTWSARAADFQGCHGKDKGQPLPKHGLCWSDLATHVKDLVSREKGSSEADQIASEAFVKDSCEFAKRCVMLLEQLIQITPSDTRHKLRDPSCQAWFRNQQSLWAETLQIANYTKGLAGRPVPYCLVELLRDHPEKNLSFQGGAAAGIWKARLSYEEGRWIYNQISCLTRLRSIIERQDDPGRYRQSLQDMVALALGHSQRSQIGASQRFGGAVNPIVTQETVKRDTLLLRTVLQNGYQCMTPLSATHLQVRNEGEEKASEESGSVAHDDHGDTKRDGKDDAVILLRDSGSTPRTAQECVEKLLEFLHEFEATQSRQAVLQERKLVLGDALKMQASDDRRRPQEDAGDYSLAGHTRRLTIMQGEADGDACPFKKPRRSSSTLRDVRSI